MASEEKIACVKKDESRTARDLLNSIFFEAGMATEELQLKPKLKKEKPTDTSGPERKSLDGKLSELSKILSELGLKDLKKRLSVDRNFFCLLSDKEQHEADSDVLFDLSKITPLVDKGFAVLDAESDEKGGFRIMILAADTTDDMDLPDSDDLKAVKVDTESLPPLDVQKLAEQLVSKVTKQ
jgi:hypothetical protein